MLSATPRRVIIITGAGGQLGRELMACNHPDAELVGFARRDLDLENRRQVAEAFGRLGPSAVINSAGYTAVDKAESEQERAKRANVDGVRNVAEEARKIGARVVHVSTDYVFDGNASTPYLPGAVPNPPNVYGSTKLEGERAFAAAGVEGVVVRTAWLYAKAGKNFLNTILGLIRSEKDLRVISDQVSTPTSASDLAPVLVRCALDSGVNGIAHWTNAGSGSWYDFAVAIQELAKERSIIRNKVQITPITTEEYRPQAPARRPAFSVLDSSHLWSRYGQPRDWRESLASVLDQMA